MNKFMIMLGLLLVVGLSFARPAPTWMQSLEGRYYCSFTYSDSLYGLAVDLNDSANLTEEQCNLHDMYSDLYFYTEPLNMLDSLEDMYNASDCGLDGIENPAAAFRSAMLSYNGMAADFRAMFNQCVRSYIQEGGSRTGLITDLGIARGRYSACLADPDSVCELPPR